MGPAILVEGLWKQYHLRRTLGGSRLSFKEFAEQLVTGVVTKKGSTSPEDDGKFWALRDLTLTIEHGESIALIGRNGAGKSTLLKIISRITRPTRGRVMLYERVNSLLEIGTGFNADLSGRDNIYLNGSFLGMKKKEIELKFDEIVAFSEVEAFIDTPVKYYSSGMFVRLAFSVAAHLTPETLLLDEVLSVGDTGFQKKSAQKMKELINSGATVVFVSHNPAVLREICCRGLWLAKGSMVMDGPIGEVLDSYLTTITPKAV
jgi:lipopolysaccharide transport system ATP-binding protein